MKEQGEFTSTAEENITQIKIYKDSNKFGVVEIFDLWILKQKIEKSIKIMKHIINKSKKTWELSKLKIRKVNC